MGTGREGGGNWEKRGWELGEKELRTGRKGIENWEKRRWELGEKEVGTGREEGGNSNWEKGIG